MKRLLPKTMKRSVFVALALVIASTAAYGQRKIQCWTDENDQRACGDSVPPRYADREREVVDDRGVIKQQVPRARTPAEQVADEEAAKQAKVEAEEQAKRIERQHAYDRFLVESYRSVKDLEKARDERLRALDTRIELVQKAIESGQQQLDALVARKQSLQKSNFPPDKRLEEQIKEYRRAIIENPKALEQLKIERQKVESQFTTDIARYQLLTNTGPSEADLP